MIKYFLIFLIYLNNNYEDSSYFPHNEFLQISLANKNYCYKSFCFQNQEICLQRNNLQKILKYSKCPEGYKCQILQDLSGKCVFDPNFKKLKYLYPGDYCKSPKDERCIYGYQECKLGICLGFKLNENCFISADCNPGMYCNNAGICKIIKKIGEDCHWDRECGRNASCLYKHEKNGICVEFFTIGNDSKINVFNIVNSNGDKIKGEYSDYLCKSGIADNNGFCFNGIESSKKGIECKIDSDCRNSSGIYSKCTCSFNNEGKKYCDLFNGDNEYIIMREKFYEYYKATVKCHNSQKWGECGQKTLYNSYKCAEFKAKNYIFLNKSTLKCLNRKDNGLFLYKDYYKYCNFDKIFKFKLLMLILLIKI